jgi:AcrR family transcriptional regulator
MHHPTKQRLLEAGLAMLLEHGYNDLGVQALLVATSTPKGSFYHHFGGRADFIRKLLRYWEVEYGGRMRDAILREPDARRRVALMERAALRQQAIDGAIRHLARSDPHAAAVERRVDRRRREALVRTFRDLGMPPERASRLADIGLAITAGTQQRERGVDARRFAGLIAEYRRWVESSVPRRR